MQIKTSSKLIFPKLSYELNGMLFKVHNQLGRYANEKQYADCIESFLDENRLNYIREHILPPSFQGELPGRNRVDFLIDNKIILEIKAKRIITREDYYQMRRYLNASNLKLGSL